VRRAGFAAIAERVALEFPRARGDNANMSFRTPHTHVHRVASTAREPMRALVPVSPAALRRHDRGTLACLGSAR